jgi:biotin carboxylase
MNSLLVLGGAAKCQAVFRQARQRGVRTILCDQDAAAPCRPLADAFHEVSATDVAALCKIGREEGVTGVLAFGSDLLALSAAEVARELGLPGNPPDSVTIMGEKDRFRAFLEAEGFPAPRSLTVASLAELETGRAHLRFPLIVKPADAAGSTAVSRIDTWDAAPSSMEAAASASRTGRVVVEEYLERSHPHMIGGDVFVHERKVVFWGLLNSHRGLTHHPFLPTGTSWPIDLATGQFAEVRNTVQAMVDRLGIRFGGLNVELLYNTAGTLHMIEIAARNGGNAIPDLLRMATGADLIGALVDASLGLPVDLGPESGERFVAAWMLGADRAGAFRSVEIHPELAPPVVETRLKVKPGDPVEPFDCAPRAVGTLFLEFASREEQHRLLARMSELVSVTLEDA